MKQQTTTQKACKNYATITLVFLTGLFYTTVTFAQNIPKLKDPTNQFIIDKVIDLDTSGGILYYQLKSLKESQLFTTYRNNTGLGPSDTMIKFSTTRDSILADKDSPEPNLFHDLYKQYYKGVLVEGSDYTIHHDGEYVWCSSGFIVEGLNVNVIPKVSNYSALEYAKAYIKCESYEWDSSGTIPEGKLVLIPIGQEKEFNASNYVLSWKFKVLGFNPEYNKDVYVNATNGEIVAEHSNNHFDGLFYHLYYGAKYDLDTHRKPGNWFTSTKWYLHADDQTRNILTTDEDGSIPFTNRYKHESYYDQNWNWDDMQYNTSGDNWGNDHWSATAAHYCASKTWDFYKQTTLNRTGMTGWGKHVRIIADYPFENAVYSKVNDNDHIRIGRINNHYLATYDIIGHEFTHGVIENSRQLPYEKVSGAINESFADIFGFMVERFAFGVVRNWTIGEDANSTLRNMQTPNVLNQPSYYLQRPYWLDPNDLSYDFGGVHFNSGVMNKWFYLLSMGGSQVINGKNRGVGGIGIDKAARIAYYTMINNTNYSPANLTFDVVKSTSIETARILYGICSNEYNQTCAAWYAVNVGNACIPCNIANWYNNSNQTFASIENDDRLPSLINLKVFPNPTNDKTTILLEELNADLNKTGYQLTVIDLNGRIVISQSNKHFSKLELDVSSLNKGIYFINLMTDNWVKTIKLVKD